MNKLQARFANAKFKPLDYVAYNKDEIVYQIVDVESCDMPSKYNIIAPNGCYHENVSEEQLKLINNSHEKSKYDSLAMYVIVKNTAPIGLGINACSHAGFLAGRKFSGKDFEDWERYSFRKRTCLVSPEEFDECIRAIKDIGGQYTVFIENDWNDQELSAAFAPRYSFPSIFKKIKLHPGFMEKK